MRDNLAAMPGPHLAAASGGLKSRAEAATYISTSQRRLDALIKSGTIRALRDGGAVKIPVVELERYISTLAPVEASA